MEFIETPIFTKQIVRLLNDSSYRKLQNELLMKHGRSSKVVAVSVKSDGLCKIKEKVETYG